jgi:hypothetical protein
MARRVFAIRHGQEAERVVTAVAEGGFAHQAFFREAQVRVKMEGAGMVAKHLKEEAMGVELLKGNGEERGEDLTAEALAGQMNDKALQLDRAGGFGEAAKNREGAERAWDPEDRPLGFPHR